MFASTSLGGALIRVIPEDVIAIIELLELLYLTNTKIARTRLIPDSTFYIQGVQHVDFQQVGDTVSYHISYHILSCHVLCFVVLCCFVLWRGVLYRIALRCAML